MTNNHTTIRRRTLLASSTAMLLAAAMPGKSAFAAKKSKRKFTLDLRCGSIGVRADQREAIRLAHEYGFESVTPDAHFLTKLSASELAELVAGMKEKHLVWGSAGMPVEFRKDEAAFRSGLKELPAIAAAMQRAGVTRTGTWLRPSHNELTYVANFRQHARRLRECAKVFKDHGQRFGLEYVGPKTLWASGRHSFVHSMAETKDLIAEIDVDNMGFVLDSWHWYTAHETVDDLRTLTNKDIVACDLNDAPTGLEIDQQIDNRRELPSATGVIDLKAFLLELANLGYDGPVRAEPFNQPLNALDNEAAAQATAAAMKRSFQLI
jgi:sugar phosphate isomerase/epimerase